MSDTDHKVAAGFSLEKLMKQVGDQSLPPVDLWNPDFCGNIDMEIRADGSWFYMGTPISRERMVRLFSTVLRHDEDGKYYLVTPVEKIGIRVEDAPFVAITVDQVRDGEDQVLIFETNVGDRVIAGPDHPLRVVTDPDSGEPRPYVLVRGRLEALLARPVFYQLVELAITEGDELVVYSAGERFPLGKLLEGDD